MLKACIAVCILFELLSSVSIAVLIKDRWSRSGQGSFYGVGLGHVDFIKTWFDFRTQGRSKIPMLAHYNIPAVIVRIIEKILFNPIEPCHKGVSWRGTSRHLYTTGLM